MKKSQKALTVKTVFNAEGKDIVKILNESVKIFIGIEVKKLCCQNS